MREITNGQLSVEQSAKRLAKKTLSILKEISTDEDLPLRKYPRAAQLHGVAFEHLRAQVSNEAITLLEKEWQELSRAMSVGDDLGEYEISQISQFYTANRGLGECRCSILLRYGIACKHYLRRAYLEGKPIPKSLLHPRWHLKGPVVRYTGWKPSYPDDEAIDYASTARPTISNHSVADLLLQMKPEEQARFARQIERSNEQLLEIGQRHLELQALPLHGPDPIPKRRVVQRKSHGKADARGLTGAELADRSLIAKERTKARAIRGTTPEQSDDEGVALIPDTPPRQLPGESQGGTTITIDLPIRTPERAQRVLSSHRAPSPLPPSSTAPPTLGDSLGKRKRTITEKYKKGRETGDVPSIGHSQQNSTPR
jgi:hypothetical protein